MQAEVDTITQKRSEKLPLGGSTSNGALAGNLTIDQERDLKKAVHKSQWEIARTKLDLRRGTKHLGTYKSHYDELLKKAGVDNTHDLVDIFIEREETNFRLYEHVAKLTKELENEERIAAYEQNELDKYRSFDAEAEHGVQVRKALEEK